MFEYGVEFYEDSIDYVLYRFQVNTRNYKVLLLTDAEFEVFNYECDVVKTFYYMITLNNEFGFNTYKDKYYGMLTKEYGEFFYQSEDDSYISAALIHINKVYNTITPVYGAIEILNGYKGTDKDVSFLYKLLTENSEYEYLGTSKGYKTQGFFSMKICMIIKYILMLYTRHYILLNMKNQGHGGKFG